MNAISHLPTSCSGAGETGTGTALVTCLATNETASLRLLTAVLLKSAAVAIVTVKPSCKIYNMIYDIGKV